MGVLPNAKESITMSRLDQSLGGDIVKSQPHRRDPTQIEACGAET